ncbi:CobD/CbiB family cobalamin biosynthesis protein [Actinomadura alba]|uniref:Cobalamin biosynthesis protein CobD n=1 Tax=Actinomadura alba TaxID=406431 RepID=A0ABR7LYI4_9ACTN|nr:CobD/CbiB family cobalamin biosynthesis protein [Actinomadura alba]MBC6469912.1 cobalamin biosynthesis protein [Actinomadura alba]
MAGLLLGVALDTVLGDPRRGHPVAAFGRIAGRLERRMHADAKPRGVLYTGLCVGGALALGVAADRLAGTGARRNAAGARKREQLHDHGGGSPAVFAGPGVRAAGVGAHGVRTSGGWSLARTATTGLATWAVLGGTSLGREGTLMARALEAGDLDAARARLPHLCARDPRGLDAKALARATVESIAENTSDAAVAPLLWGAVAGVPGLLAYRAINTLDAMVGYRNPRYENFGWAAARLDDLANWIPARVTGLLTVACATLAGPAPTSVAPCPDAGSGEQLHDHGRGPSAVIMQLFPLPRSGPRGHRTERPARARTVSARTRTASAQARTASARTRVASAQARTASAQARTAIARSRESYEVLRRDGGAHPSPNAGRCEAAFAGALGVRLGGVNSYDGRVEERPELGDGRPPEVADIRRAVRLSRAVTLTAALLSAVIMHLFARATRGGRP